jgi:putative membrane protein
LLLTSELISISVTMLTMLAIRSVSFALLLAATSISAWAPQQAQLPPTPRRSQVPTATSRLYGKPTPGEGVFDPLNFSDDLQKENHHHQASKKNVAVTATRVSAVGALALLSSPDSAMAAVAGTPNAIGAAFAAYGHYLSVIAMASILMYERISIKPNMSIEAEKQLGIADGAYGIFGGLLAYSGYLRLSFEKGWEFYSHEPIFWLKILFLGVYGASSFFNTAIIIKRTVGIAQDPETFQPMSEKLAARMIQLCNAQATALALIPLTATFMARGIAYSESIPWQAEAGVDALVFAGLSYKYIKEALTFEDEPASE